MLRACEPHKDDRKRNVKKYGLPTQETRKAAQNHRRQHAQAAARLRQGRVRELQLKAAQQALRVSEHEKQLQLLQAQARQDANDQALRLAQLEERADINARARLAMSDRLARGHRMEIAKAMPASDRTTYTLV